MSHAAPLVNNGDFESGIAGWTVGGGNPTNPDAYNQNFFVPRHSGDWALDLGPMAILAITAVLRRRRLR